MGKKMFTHQQTTNRMSFNIQDVATQNNIGQNLFGPSWTLTQDIERSAIYRKDAKKDALVRDVVMKGLPVISEAQLRKGHDLPPISMVAKAASVDKAETVAKSVDEHNHEEQEDDHDEHDSSKPVNLARENDVTFGPVEEK